MAASRVCSAQFLDVESRLFINPLDEQVGPASAPLLECLNGREMIESPLGNAVVA